MKNDSSYTQKFEKHLCPTPTRCLKITEVTILKINFIDTFILAVFAFTWNNQHHRFQKKKKKHKSMFLLLFILFGENHSI